MRRSLLPLLVGLLLIVSAAPATAARPTVDAPDGTFAETLTVTIGLGGRAKSADNLWVLGECHQEDDGTAYGSLVYRQYERVSADLTAVLTLGPTPRWDGGDADCTVTLLFLRDNTANFSTLAEDTFYVSG